MLIARVATERFFVIPSALRRARESAGLSQAELARRAGWSRQQQCHLEHGRTDTIGADALDTLQRVLQEAGVKTEVE